MDDKSLKAQLDAALAENAALKAQADRKVTLKVSEKGAVSVYGMGRFPVTLYQEQWLKLLAMGETITGFITLHQDKLESKGDDEATKAVKAAKRAAFRGDTTPSTPPAAPGKPLVPPTTVAQPPVKRYSSRG